MLLGTWDVNNSAFLYQDASPQNLEHLGVWGLWLFGNRSDTSVKFGDEVQFAASETLFASSWSCFSSSEDAMEYSKEFVTAVVLGKDLVPRQVEKCLNVLMNICSTHKSPPSYHKHLNHICLHFPHSPVLVTFYLSSCTAASFTWTSILVFHTAFYRHIPAHLSAACIKEKGEYPASNCSIDRKSVV